MSNGAPPAGIANMRTADRGIGGTGGPAGVVRQADRGIGGTGIIAVITGFASICLGGQEVALDSDAAVLIEDRPAAATALRAGQVAVVDAAGGSGDLRARRIAVRYEVSGPVDSVDGDTLHVAGQAVVWTPATWGGRPDPGEWVAVSGLRRTDGVIEATRLDRAMPGRVVVRGLLVRDMDNLRIGALPIRQVRALAPVEGYVSVTGTLEAGVLRAEQIVPDLLASDPYTLFSSGVSAIFIESLAVVRNGRVQFGQGFSASAPDSVPSGAHRAVLALERGGSEQRGGGFRATGIWPELITGRPAAMPGGGGAPMPTQRFLPAPVPDHSLRPEGEQAPGSSGRGSADHGRYGSGPRSGWDGPAGILGGSGGGPSSPRSPR